MDPEGKERRIRIHVDRARDERHPAILDPDGQDNGRCRTEQLALRQKFHEPISPQRPARHGAAEDGRLRRGIDDVCQGDVAGQDLKGREARGNTNLDIRQDLVVIVAAIRSPTTTGRAIDPS